VDPEPDPEGKTDPQKKNEEISSFEVLDVLFCRLKASIVAWKSIMGDQGISKLQLFFSKIKFFTAVKFFQFWSFKFCFVKFVYGVIEYK
jgi:hypothetical protein